MPDLIIIRLYPTEPTSANDFRNYLQNELTITAHDLTFGESKVGVPIGSEAKGLASSHINFIPDPDNPGGQLLPIGISNGVDIGNTSIMQHYVDEPDDSPTGLFIRKLEAAATAVIVVDTPVDRVEYPEPYSFDIRLELKRGGLDISERLFNYNVRVERIAGDLPNNQPYYFERTASAYVALPPPEVGLNPELAHVTLPANGAPPDFDELRQAIDDVLEKDPDNANADLEHLSPLTPAQSDLIAHEIAWNRQLHPPPELPRPLGQMYTKPDNGNVDDAAENARKKFEAELNSYYATREAEAIRLANFVFAASAAVACEQMSANAKRAGLRFPIITDASTPTAISSATVVVTVTDPDDPNDTLNPPLIVPAAYFYALGAMLPPEISADKRYDIALLETEENLLTEFQVAVDAGSIVTPAAPVTATLPAANVNENQAARRLARSLGLTKGALFEVALAPPITDLVAAWLAYANPSASIDEEFWKVDNPGNQPSGYFELVLPVVTGNHQPLMDALTEPTTHNIDSVSKLVSITDKQWRQIFLNEPGEEPNLEIIPPFTLPGTPAECVEAFLGHLRKFFEVQIESESSEAPEVAAQPAFDLSSEEIFSKFVISYNAISAQGDFAFGSNWDSDALIHAISETFPADSEAQSWLKQALETIDSLYKMTDIIDQIPNADDEIDEPDALHFSLMESLYARGFTSSQSASALSSADFEQSLTGTVAYRYASLIHSNAGTTTGTPEEEAGFKSINSDGLLTDCIPPEHLSPFGPVQFLHELLKLSQLSTCDNPFPNGVGEGGGDAASIKVGELFANRRGPLASLHPSRRANLKTPLPLIDLVNENLEVLVAKISSGATGEDVGGGAVYDTAGVELAGHKLLRQTDNDPSLCAGGQQHGCVNSQGIFLHDPLTLFEAVPQHSSPATPVEQSAAYNALKSDFTSPWLPYSQQLDICRSYLHNLGTSLYAVKRTFHKEITEFVLDPNANLLGFQSHLRRYPVKENIAIEYLGISAEVHNLLFTQDIAIDPPTDGRLLLRELYGFDSDTVGATPWFTILEKVPEFLKRTGLTYCELIELARSEFVRFNLHTTVSVEELEFDHSFEGIIDCEPCCLDRTEIVVEGDDIEGFKRLAVFIRLWRILKCVGGAGYTFKELRDICEVLVLFREDGTINSDFLRQAAAFKMLRDNCRLPLTERADDATAQPPPGATGAERTHILALWVGPDATKWTWAVDRLLDGIETYARKRYPGCRRCPPELVKLLSQNLDSLSRLVGFDPTTTSDTWHALPTHTLRFAEILSKIYASDFGVGEIFFLFTADDHLNGDDPFPMPDENESLASPLHLPDDEDEYSLLALRHKLLNVCVSDQEIAGWTWPSIENSLRNEFGFVIASAQNQPDPLQSLGEHFFPSILEACGVPVSLEKRQYRVGLNSTLTTPLMWNIPPNGPFRYDANAQVLWTQIPLKDEDVNAKLASIRQLNGNNVEQKAVQDLYFLPGNDLAPLGFMFSDFAEAEECLIQEPDEKNRWAYFQREFACFHARCWVIAEHLANHVACVTNQKCTENCRNNNSNSLVLLAWHLLRHLFADENKATTPWEHDGGQVPDVTWKPQPNGGAFSALVRLATGTGLLGEYTPHGGKLVWRETRGPLSAFGHVRNEWNSPVPTVLPSMGLTLSPEDERFAAVQNGFGIRSINRERLGGAQGFFLRWIGVLLVDKDGQYEFFAGAPTPDCQLPNFEEAARGDRSWHVTLKRGQKRWVLLNHGWVSSEGGGDHEGDGGEGEEMGQGGGGGGSGNSGGYRGRSTASSSSARSGTLALKAGAYHIKIEFLQLKPSFSRQEDVCPQFTGFQIKYCGPDTEDQVIAIPLNRLFRDKQDGTLDAGIDTDVLAEPSEARRFLKLRYTSSLRDIRRTMQRLFKALLFSYRFCLSAKPVSGDVQSEIGHMLAFADRFLGTSYYRQQPPNEEHPFATHHAYFNFNFLFVNDPYYSPTPDEDIRVQPTVKRMQALFDWWERIFDYVTVLRRETKCSLERPAWLLFYEAAHKQPDDLTHPLRYLENIDIRHVSLVTRYYDSYNVQISDLEDERWAIRVWQAEKLIRAIMLHFMPKAISEARPDLWASDNPATSEAVDTPSGNENLTRYYRDGCIENGEPRRYEDVKILNDGLRQRARDALLAYLCGMNRVPLPWLGPGTFAQVPRDISDLLLQDVETGTCEKASRIEEGITAIHSFVQRARLGLEPGFAVSPNFVHLWERRFATFRVWEECKRREIYRENWIEWDELRKAQKSEAFSFLESELRRSTLTVPVPGGMNWWPNRRPPVHPSLTPLQSREPAMMHMFSPGSEPQGFGLLGTPERHARPSWLAPIVKTEEATPPEETLFPEHPSGELPFWIQAAIRLGTRFVRVAAAGIPPASAALVASNPEAEMGCCIDCGKVHPPFVDEYYFWLQDSRYFEEVSQNADEGAQLQPTSPDDALPDTTSDWHRPERLPRLLHWESEPMVHLFWCRVHNGEFQQLRRSDEGLRIDKNSNTIPELNFLGRSVDSLLFKVTGGLPFPGYDSSAEEADDSPPGFRYDLPVDSAIVLPLVVAPPAPDSAEEIPGGLNAYPFFIYFSPGSRLQPPSMFSVAMVVAGVLRAHCLFEAALKWYELAFNPLKRDNTWVQCDALALLPFGTVEPDDMPCCPSAPVNDDEARDRAILLHYLETLLQWGDAQMCKNSPEAFQQARVIFDTLKRILGSDPNRILRQENDEEEEGGPESEMTLADFVARPSSLNPRLLSLYEESQDRLSLIHHCINARRLRNGRPNIDMPYWGNSPLRDGWKSSSSIMKICQDEDDWCLSCCSPYRFTFLIRQAIELAGEASRLGGELLAAYEKGDAEYLASLRATHERQLLHLALQVRQNQWREADWQLQALMKTKEGAQTRKRYFEQLIQKGLNSGEIGHEALGGVSIASRAAGNISEAIAQGMTIPPDMFLGVAGIMGSPLEFNQLPIGNKLAANFATAARILNALAEIAITSGSLSLTSGGYSRREEEWRHQVEVIGIEIEQIERQILAAERRKNIALRELNNHQRQMEHSVEVQNFLRDKFTSHELYLFLQQETAAIYRQTFDLASQCSWQAQGAFNYERGHTTQDFIPDGIWDNLHEGLRAGDRLQLANRQMERAYYNENCREYELTKHISLQKDFPMAFLCLKMTGYCEIEIAEWMFDLDYAGHYMRRTKNVSLTIPCVVGPYTGVHCRLTLLSSMIRTDPRLRDIPSTCCSSEDDDNCDHVDCSCKRKNGYTIQRDDPRIVKQYAATEAIATSSGQNDPGMFELNFRDERYLPFEFAGAACSRWRIEIPPENNHFDMDTISDVVLHLNYTAREGGDVLRKAANEIAQQCLPGNGLRVFDFKREFPDAWHYLQHPRKPAMCEGNESSREIGLRLNRNMFPFVPGHHGRDLKIHQLELLFETEECAEPGAHKVVEFLIGHRAGHDHHQEHKHNQHPEDICHCEVRNIYCVASSKCPGLYHGVLDIYLGPLSENEYQDFGTFRFSPDVGKITRVFLFCGYNVKRLDRCK